MSEHTKGQLRLNAGDSLKIMDAANRVAFNVQCGGMTGISLADAESNAETLVARWNALEGYNPAAVRDVVEAAKGAVHFSDAVALGNDPLVKALREWLASLSSALAALEGGAP